MARECALQRAHTLGWGRGRHATPSEWLRPQHLADTGSAYHLCSRSSTLRSVLQRSSLLEIPLDLLTANGPTCADEGVGFWHPVLERKLDNVLMDNTLEVLSIGAPVLDEKIDLLWLHGYSSNYLRPDGQVVWIKKCHSLDMDAVVSQAKKLRRLLFFYSRVNLEVSCW